VRQHLGMAVGVSAGRGLFRVVAVVVKGKGQLGRESQLPHFPGPQVDVAVEQCPKNAVPLDQAVITPVIVAGACPFPSGFRFFSSAIFSP
jgi:hypothetical protein